MALPGKHLTGTGYCFCKIFTYHCSHCQVYDDDALREFDEKPCQFFAYKTNFRTLEDVFSMSKKRAALKKDQWYVGW